MSWKERPKRPMFCIPLSVHENTEDEEETQRCGVDRKVLRLWGHMTYQEGHVTNTRNDQEQGHDKIHDILE